MLMTMTVIMKFASYWPNWRILC